MNEQDKKQIKHTVIAAIILACLITVTIIFSK